MMSPLSGSRRLGRAGALVLPAVLVALTVPATAQTPDARWQPWIGCWTPSTTQFVPGPERVSGQVCVVPATGTSAADIVTVAADGSLSREHIEASGERRSIARDGCAGWERAQWSSDTRRVYLESEYQCPGGVTRSTTGLMAMSASGDWLNLVGVSLRENTAVRVLRHRSSAPRATLPADVRSALTVSSALVEAARAEASAAIDPAAVADASRHVGAAVTESWLAEHGRVFRAEAGRLVELADAGVADRVIDVIVALSYPHVFAIRPLSPTTGLPETTSLDQGGEVGWTRQGSCDPYGGGFSLYGWDGCSPYGYAGYGYYGLPSYDYLLYGNLAAYGGWYSYRASQPAVVVRPPEAASSGHGRVINGSGYSAGGGGSSGGSSSSAGSTSSGNSAPSGAVRTAVPR
jgi:hypothetical protein